MFCEQCGHALNEKMICPICGWRSPAGVPNGQPNIQYNQQPNTQPNMQYRQPNAQPNMQYGQPNAQLNMHYRQPNAQPNMQYQQPNAQPNMQYQQPNAQSNMQYRQPNAQSNMQYRQPNAQPNMQYQQPNAQPNMQYRQPGGQPYGQPNMQYGQPNGQPSMQYRQPGSNPPQKKKKKWPIFVGVGAGVICLTIGLVLIFKKPTRDYTTTESNRTTEHSASTEPTTEPPTTQHQNVASGSKTLMIYVVGSDLESKHQAASDDIDEMLSSGYDESAMNVLLYTGGCSDWHTSEIPENENATFIIENQNLKLLSSEASSNMGNPDNLSGFLNYCYTNYPAEQYELILWNHGGGAFFGYGYDEITEDMLTLSELQTALSNSPFHDGNKLEFIGFDACLMGNIETAHALSPYANYLIASQESEPGSGWDYSFLAEIDTMSSGADMGTSIVDIYMEKTTEYINSIPFAYYPICLSVLDLSKIDSVETALNDLFAKADQDLSADTYPKFSAYRKNSKEIAASFSYTEGSYDIVDMVDYANHLRNDYPAEVSALTNALSELVVYSDANEANINGVSIYHPYYTKQYASQLIPIYTSFDFADNYTHFISAFAGMLTDTNAFTVAWDPSSLKPIKNDDMTFSVTLQPDQMTALQNAYFVISKKDKERDGYYDMVAISSAVNSDGTSTLTADFDGQIIYMQNDTTLEKLEIMYSVQEKTDTFTRYLISSILYNDDIQGEDAMYTYFVLEVSDANPQGVLLGAYPIENYINTEGNEIFPDRYEINISDYQNVAFGYFSHEFTSEENLTSFNQADWSDLMLNYHYFPVSEGFSPVKDGLIPGEEYYGMFIFEDMQGNRHCSDLVQLQ